MKSTLNPALGLGLVAAPKWIQNWTEAQNGLLDPNENVIVQKQDTETKWHRQLIVLHTKKQQDML